MGARRELDALGAESRAHLHVYRFVNYFSCQRARITSKLIYFL
jgi:hypothetical protein